MLDLRDIPVFIQTAEAGSFSAAANRLHLTRSAVAKTIARMEQRLGVRLFHRTTRSQSLTEEGILFHERCLRALQEIRAGEAMLESGRKEIRGRLRIALPVVLGRTCIAPILMRLLAEHTGLELDISFSDLLVDFLEDGFDLAVRNGALRDDSDVMSRVIARQRMTVCASPAYLDARGEPQTLEEIDRHETIVYARNGVKRSWLFPTPDMPGRSLVPRARLQLDDLEAIADAACAGFGLAWMPCWLVRDRIADGRLRQILLSTQGFAFPSHVIWPKSPIMLPRTRLVIDRLATELPLAMG
ncbi:LysR family transcriptional regulator [Rhizobium sp. PP-F2F-G20b]|nr:LysR family transcriptional regulator [Rhizobium sp. PP-F2F-G20b]